MEQLTRRVDALEVKAYQHEADIASLKARVDNVQARHSSTPAWIFGAIAAFTSISTLLFNLYLSGVRP